MRIFNIWENHLKKVFEYLNKYDAIDKIDYCVYLFKNITGV